MKSFVTALWLALPVAAAFAESETPAPADLLVVPEVTERPAAEGEAAAQPTSTPESTPAVAESEEPVAPVAEETVAEEIVPPPFPLSRYEDLWKKSPFQLESTAPPVESAGLAQRYALTGIAEINGEPIAFVMERATQQRMMVRKDGGPASGGLSLVQVDVAQKKNEDSTVTLRQGAEVGVVRFDAGPTMPGQAMAPPMAQGMMSQQAPPVVPAPPVPGINNAPQPPQMPGQPGQMAGVPPQSAPGVVPPVPGPGIQQPGQPPMPPPRVIRRRAIVPAAP